MNTDKEAFLREFGNDYGYPSAPFNIDQIRASQFKRLDGLVYLDHAGSTLYSESQMEAVLNDLTTSVYGNPHSQSDTSLATCDIVREARQQVLDHCNASPKDYKCIFTSGATAALKLVGEAFPWSSESNFMYTMENHNSVLGIREYALDRGASAFAIDIEEAGHHGGVSRNTSSSIKVSPRPIQRRNQARFPGEAPTGYAHNLFAFPSECNFSGVRFSLDLVKIIKEDAERILTGPPFYKGCWMVLIDAAKGCATKPPDLSKYPADFVVISFYKLFGYPTGLGALIVRSEAAKLLKKTYFSGGTVAASIADIDFVKRRNDIEELFEDGTASFLSIASIRHGFKLLNTITISAISRHTSLLSTYVRKQLLALRHDNGSGVCMLYGGFSSEKLCNEMGPIVTFNLKRPDGSWFGYREVEKLASLSRIQLRTGCFCNPGACAKYLGLSHSDLLSNIEAGHVCWDDNDIIHGKPTGAVRVSFGYMSTFEDAKKFIDFIVSSFVSVPYQSGQVHLPRSIPYSSEGLLHDREWILKSLTGEILTQKKVPEMHLITTFIDLSQGILFVESPRCKRKLRINLKSDSYCGGKEAMDLQAQRYEVQGYHNEVNIWFSNALARPCTLLRCSSSQYYSCLGKRGSVGMCRDVETRLNFVNEAQFLLISEESVSDLNSRLRSNVQKSSTGPQIQLNPLRFRPNLVISGGEPYHEDGWLSLKIGNKCFTSLGGCNRCQMINLDNQAGQVQKSTEPLATLASYRRIKGKILFGILLRYENDNEVGQEADSWLQVGQEVDPNFD
ncbi:molybdenum cofactor sulfurase isoform X2 [Vitis vinifera]|uniref:molybdenum cofactor sulfurase isoform X2 n=1 Tax=Vitis vinifera TaxID=29760 RepID=UPI0028830BF4|nr:molybdenum cofactor sulfurase isoform X2 [Vitis vinifera]